MDLLAAEEHERDRSVVLVLDEAHLMGADQLEELRLLGNSEMDSHSPFAALLVGQPTLGGGSNWAPSPPWTVGRSDTLFSDDALALIHQVSRGLPRAVNNLAVQALVAAYATNKAVVDESSARAAVTEVTTE